MQFSEREERQISLMRNLLAMHRRDQISISSLVGEFDFLIEALEEVSDEYKEKLRQEWGVLEEVYAVGLDRNEKELSEDNKKLVDRTVENLENILSGIAPRG